MQGNDEAISPPRTVPGSTIVYSERLRLIPYVPVSSLECLGGTLSGGAPRAMTAGRLASCVKRGERQYVFTYTTVGVGLGAKAQEGLRGRSDMK
jgi:hypothetical protein